MITHLSHITVFVRDQDAALEFYTKKLGFSVDMDARLGDFRWLTVRPPEQKELVIALLNPAAMFDDAPEVVEKIWQLLDAKKLGGGVFQTDDCTKTYEELKARGVPFRQPPQQRPYGIEAIMEDNSGNWYSVTQPARVPANA
ncbi:glyoxalase [Opitutaceae bacterium EW11]|nr:glyoxalase [Opitutaceae bacterium EW11]